MLDSAGTSGSKLARVARAAASLDDSLARMPGAQVEAGTVVLDNNVRAGIDELIRGVGKKGKVIDSFADLDENYRDAINALRAARKLGPYVDKAPGERPTVEDIVGPGADLRMTPLAGAEAVAGETLSGKASPLVGTMRGVKPNHTDPDYANVIGDLAAAPPIGTAKGAIDRTVVADAMFAEKATGVTPVLVSADRDVVPRLAQRFGVGPRTFAPGKGVDSWLYLIDRIPEGRFTIEIRGHRLDVVFHEPTGRPPVK
jgi:hypothetical protein